PSPATSSPGLGFLMANIGGLGEEGAFKWWAQMRQNGVKVAKGWSEAYYTDFSHNGGAYPLVVGYAASPAAEVYFSKGKYSEPPTGNLFLKGGVFRQVEGAAVLKGAKQPKLAAKLVQWLQSPEVQQAVPSEMWVYPAVKNTRLPDVFRFAQAPAHTTAPAQRDIDANQRGWVSRWIRTVLK
ncbi:TPA: thiamine ABC transporter substrate-binding protein, partial [Neisseria gonorrhoeae]